ncbi:unnamed protein product [Rhizoctonia solani]|uniref:Nephrocystin 3-like N-terminal domain-containing protein n=1 Tax=Rhizoctonia solani TaxID=456999 RepID=A0A8H3H4C9_9AGAM|nr:unnamed protein product [Rhizoctonia solani]
MPKNDPATFDAEPFRLWITDIEVTPGNNDTGSKFSARIFIDHELVCNLPWIDHTRPLRWSGLMHCNASSLSTVAVRLCRSVKNKLRYFNFPPFTVSEVDETGESTLELPESAWTVTIRFLTPIAAYQLFLDGLGKLDAIGDAQAPSEVRKSPNYVFQNALQLARLAAEFLPGCTAKISFLICLRAWELLDRKAHPDDAVQAIFHGSNYIRDIVDTMNQASNSILFAAMEQSKGPIKDILALLEDISVHIFNRCAINDLMESNNVCNIDAYLSQLGDLQKAFYASWLSTVVSYKAPIRVVDNEFSDISQNSQDTIDEQTKTTGLHEILDLLRPRDLTGYDPDQACLDGTRETIINKIITWTQNRGNSETCMWISGPPGMGKTAIAASLCQRLDSFGALAGSFFCRHRLGKAYLSRRYEGLIKGPLKKLRSLTMHVMLVVVVDALDECGDSDSREKVLKMLHEMSQLVSWLKIIFTGRLVGDLQESFRNNCPHGTILHIQSYDASNDIRAYIESQLGQLAKTECWPHDSIDKLYIMTQGVFLWAVLATKYIKKAILPPLLHLRKVLNSQKSPVTDHYDALYTRVLELILGDHDDETKDAYFRCLGIILVTSERGSLTMSDLQCLLAAGQVDKFTFERIVKNLGPLLFVTDQQCVKFYHPSFWEYITNSSRSEGLSIQLDRYESESADLCLKVMQQNLKFNICELETSHILNSEVSDLGYRIDSHIGSALKYVCTHWVDHFAGSPNQALVEATRQLLEGPQLLYWVEVLSLLERMDVAISGLYKLILLELAHFDGWSLIVTWAKDAHRFLLSFCDAIAASTPHLYVSALAFAPSKSHIARRLGPFFPNIIRIVQGGDQNWHPCIKSVLHPHAIQSLSISPNGSSIVTGYPDGSIGLWDLQTGVLITKSLVGHSDVVLCVTFSPDGNLVASSSDDTTIRVWDVGDRLKTSRVLAGHSSAVNSVVFSPDARVLASGASDKTIRLWDPKSMRPISEPYIGHSSRVSSVVFSPDGTQLVSGSWDKTIRVWSVDIINLELASDPLMITGHSDAVTCVAFSPDGSTIASGSVDKSIQICDAQTGRKVETRTLPAQHSDSVTSIAFSSDGERIVSSSLDGAIHVHSATTLEPILRPFGHFRSVNGVVFSPNGCLVISGSADMTTRVWEISLCPKSMTVAPIVGHSSTVRSIAISRDGTRIISGSYDQTVRMWDAQTGHPVGKPFVGHSSNVLCVAMSPDGTRIASGSSDKTLKHWDTTTYTTIHSHQHNSEVYCVAFSFDGSLVAFGSEDGQVYLWDPIRHNMIGDALPGHSRCVLSVAFSPDGACLASSSKDTTVILRDVKTRNRLGGPFLGHTAWVTSISFSPCGTQLVSSSDDKTVRLWDIKSGRITQELLGHSTYVTTAAFSPDGRCIASGSWDNTVRLWNAKTGRAIGRPFSNHTDHVWSIAFSLDGNYVISGSADKTIRVWGLETSSPPPEQASGTPGAFCWPTNPYELSPHLYRPGWVTDDQQAHIFWLPIHYQQPDQFFSSHTRTSCLQLLLDYSNFVHGSAWSEIARHLTVSILPLRLVSNNLCIAGPLC